MENKNEDKDNLDKYYEDSIFSVTEDVQYPLFDAEKAKSGILTQNRDSEREQAPKLEKKSSTKSRFQNQMPSFSFNASNSARFGESFEAEIKIDEPLNLSRDYRYDPTLSRPTSSIFSQSLGLNLSGLPNVGRGRPIGVIRPTPQVGRKDL